MKHDLIQLAKNVFELEAKAVSSLTKKLDDTFIEVLNMIFNSKGRLVICGMGKSGHIGKKIAATLASTGTPSFLCTRARLITVTSVCLPTMIL